jgi:hypothetical protein
MSIEATKQAGISAGNTSVAAKMVGVFVTPGLVFDEVAAAPPKTNNWLAPLVLVSLSSLLVLKANTSTELISNAINPFLQEGKLTQEQTAILTEHWQTVSAVGLCVATFAAAFWSALVIWLIGRVVLKTAFSFLKALEVVSLSGSVLILGAIVTALLIAATGDASARPALSLFLRNVPPGNALRRVAGILDCFELWAVAILTIGLSKLSAVTVKESAFWVLGYWLLARIALVLLA